MPSASEVTGRTNTPPTASNEEILRRLFTMSIDHGVEDLTPRTFPFLNLPLEIREMIYAIYLEDTRNELSKPVHYDDFDNPCCLWELGKGLNRNIILCDKDTRMGMVSPSTTPFFLPRICFSNKQIRGEVARLMLRDTKTYVFKNYCASDIKITQYFMEFLEAVSTPNYNAFDHVEDMTVPHIYREPYDYGKENPTVTLMVKCEKMRVIRLTFHASYLSEEKIGKYNQFHMSLDAILDKYALRPILNCKGLEEVYLTGIIPHAHMRRRLPHDCLKGVKEIGHWIRKGFEAQGRNVKVLYCKRKGAWTGSETFAELEEPKVSHV